MLLKRSEDLRTSTIGEIAPKFSSSTLPTIQLMIFHLCYHSDLEVKGLVIKSSISHTAPSKATHQLLHPSHTCQLDQKIPFRNRFNLDLKTLSDQELTALRLAATVVYHPQY